MKLIPLTQGKFAIVDDEDFEKVSKYKWCAQYKKNTDSFYAVRGTSKTENGIRKQKTISMQRFIMDEPKGMVIDHINHATLDNRKENLRVCTIAENSRNRRVSKRNTSGFTGVSWHKQERKWHARIVFNMKTISLGLYENVKDANEAYRVAAIKYFDKFLN